MKITLRHTVLSGLTIGALILASTAIAAELQIKKGSDYAAPAMVEGTTAVDTAKAYALWKQRAFFVDPRSNSDWQAGRVPGALHIQYDPGKPDQELTQERLAQDVAKDDPVVFYCNGEHCDRSPWAAHLAVKWGWKHVYYYRDGFPAWKKAGYPVE